MRKTKEMMDATHKRHEKVFVDQAELEDDEPETGKCLCGKTGEINYDDGTERRFYCYCGPECCP